MTAKSFQAEVIQDERTAACGIELPFDPKEHFGKIRTPVQVTINGHTFRTTTCLMGGSYWIPINKSNRDNAGLSAGERVSVRIEPDTAPRVIAPPPELAKALRSHRSLKAAWDQLSYTRQKECAQSVMEAKKSETRQRRIARVVDELKHRP